MKSTTSHTRHIFLSLIGLIVAGVLPARAQVAVHQDEGSSPGEMAEVTQTRYFQEVQNPAFPGAYHALARIGYNGDFILLVETNADRTPISDTLLVWIQHHGPDQPLAPQARWADLIVSCHPELLAEPARPRHVLPDAHGKVWLYFVENRHLIISDQRHPALDFALKANL